MYICGGFNGQECLNTAEYFIPDTGQWTLITNMNNRRSGVGVIAYNDCIYALGGFNGVTRMNTGERYCPRSRQWVDIPDMYSPRSNFATEVIIINIVKILKRKEQYYIFFFYMNRPTNKCAFIFGQN